MQRRAPHIAVEVDHHVDRAALRHARGVRRLLEQARDHLHRAGRGALGLAAAIDRDLEQRAEMLLRLLEGDHALDDDVRLAAVAVDRADQHHGPVVHDQLAVLGERVGEQHRVHRRVLVGEAEDHHLRAGILALRGHDHARARDEARDHARRVLRHVGELLHIGRAERLHLLAPAVERMARDVEAERLLLEPQRLHAVPRRDLAERRSGRGRSGGFRCGSLEHPEEVLLPARAVARERLARADRALDARDHARAVVRAVQRIKAARLHEAFDARAVHALRVDALAEVEHALERPVLAAFLDHRAHRAGADALDRLEAEADVPAPCAALLIGAVDDREVLLGEIDVGRLDLDADVRLLGRVIGIDQLAAIVEVDRPLLDLARLAFKAQHRRHVVRGKVRLEVRGLVRDDRVARRVRLVEAVSRELQDELEQLLGLRGGQALLARALDERRAHAVDLVDLLLRDRLDERVRRAQRHAAEVVHDLHHLLLVDHDAVGLVGKARHDIVHLGDFLRPVLARVVVGDEIHRTRPEQRVRRDQILEAVGLHAREQLLHAARFELEHAVGIGAAEELEHLLVVERNTVEIERMRERIGGNVALLRRGAADGAVDLLDGQRVEDHLLRELDRRQRAQPEEVHLEQADLLAGRSVPLRDRFLRAAGRAAKRDDVVERTRRDDHARGVHALVARVVLEALRMVEHALDARVGRHELGELGLLLQRHVERDLELVGHEVREVLPLGGSEAHHARDVLDRGLRLESAEGDDLRDMAVLLAHVVDHGGAAVLADIDIDIGVLGAVGIGESLEQQAVLLRARVGEAEHVARHRADARTTRVRGNAALARPVHEVPHDQEVRADRLVGEDLELAVEARADLRRDAVGTVAPDRACFAEVAQRAVAARLEVVLGLGVLRRVERQRLEQAAIRLEPLGQVAVLLRVVLGSDAGMLDLDDGRVILALGQRHVAARGDAARVEQRLGVGRVGKEPAHLVRALHVERLGILETRRIVLVLLHRDAAERVVRVVVLGGEEVRVVVDDEREIEFLRELAEVRVDLLLLGHMALQLDVEARLALLVRLERRGVPLGLGDGALPEHGILARLQVVLEVRRDRAAEVAVDRDDAVRPLRERRLVHARLVVEAVEERVRRELEQVAPALDVLGEQHEVPAAVLLAGVGLVAAIALLSFAVDGDVALDAEDRLDAELLGLHVELHRAEHVAVVGDRDGVHAEFLHALEQALDLVPAVEQRVLRVQVEVREHRGRVRGWRRSFSHRSSSS